MTLILMLTSNDYIYIHSSLTLFANLVKAMVFPVAMYGCESWTIKKAECQSMMLLNCGVEEDS